MDGATRPRAIIFSERELTFTFAICYRRSVCLRLSVCNVGAPYLADWNFRQFFFAIWYLGQPLTSTENFYRDCPSGNPSVGGLNARRVAKYSNFSRFECCISEKRGKIGSKLVLITNRKSYMCFRLVPKSVTLNDLERRNGPYFYRIW